MQNINLTGQSSQNLQSSLLNSNLKATEQMQYQEPENLEKLIQSIHDAERQQIRPSMKIIITCKQILRGIKQIGLERDPAWQKQVLKYFELFLENKLTKLRSRFTDLTRPVQNFSQQIERFEAQLFDIGTFALKSDWNAKLYRILNRGEPDCCILCNTEIVLPDLLKNERGVLLQMACTNHNRKLAVTYTTVFGVLKPNCIHLNLYYGLDLQKNTRLGAQEAADLENYHEWRVTRFREMNKSYMQNCQEIHYLELGQRYVSYVGSTFSGIFDPADDDIKDCLIKDWRVESLDQFCDSYCNRLRKVLQEQLIAEEDDQSKEGMQYDNLLIVKTYEMFINYFAVLHSFSPHQVQECHPTITDEEEPDLEREMRHYDYFIQTMHSDLESKFLRYKVHEFAQRKLYHNLLTWMAPSTNDQKLYVRMQKLVNLPKYQLNYIPKIKSNQDPPADGRYRCIKECTAIDRVTKKRIYQCCEGHAVANCPIRSVRAWCNPEIYKDAINHLSKMLLFETPHSKAQAVQEACQSALLAMEVADVFEDVEYNNAELNLFLIKYLFVQVCCKFRQKDRLPKFYQQLLYVISFDLPMREEAFYRESQSENFLKKQDNELVDDPIKKGEITASQMRNRKMLAKCASVDGKQFVHIMWRFANEILYAPESDFKNL